ncbi:hypothetical protein ES332_D12G194100v1 [Gossypium tomentosum]|uniref:AB hydrolase-1 domain-containing protein n=1 Tax=Gossypium tomentosum TaxID=34277 RepID=A0A5D2IC56_GOSTO|nr:hypothetical protein ES332_D12G194100v1 [Gossypium tomentosum]
MLTLTSASSALTLFPECKTQRRRFSISAAADDKFPSFLPKQMEEIKDPFARKLATRIERLPVNVSFSEKSIMSSCVKPLIQSNQNPVVLLHSFDSSCLEWRYTFPLLEEAGLETWAIDILGWGFSNLERIKSCDVASKREHFYQLWKSYIKRPMTLVGPSLGAAVAVDFAVNHPEAVENLVLIDASVYAEGTGNLAKLPRAVAYAGFNAYQHMLGTFSFSLCEKGVGLLNLCSSDSNVSILKSFPLRLYTTFLAFKGLSFDTGLDWVSIGKLHCLYPWWEDATVSFMISGGYNVSRQIDQVMQKTLIIWGEDDQIISNKLAVRLHCELPNSNIRQIPDCGHLPHVEKPDSAARLILEFMQNHSCQKKAQLAPTEEVVY